MLPTIIRCPALLIAVIACLPLAADIPENPEPAGMGLGDYSYWSSSPFANTMLTAHDWIAFGPGEWGQTVHYEDNPQFDANGYPRYLQPNQRLRTLMWPFHARYASGLPESFPDRARSGNGKWVLTWRGEADLRMDAGQFIPEDSSGPATGSLLHGRRAYRMPPGVGAGHLVVESVNPDQPVTDIKVWMPDPADPQNRSLEGQFWHPDFLAYLQEMPLNHLRFMDWISTNQSPQRDWADRRLPSHRHQHGVLNRRNPAPGATWYTDSEGNPVPFPGDRSTGIAWEYVVDLANRTGLDPWICIPHLATDDYVRKVARLFLYGSDGQEPYTAPQKDPVYPPLDPGLTLWLEYSNEIWSNGNSFPQGNWAQAKADAAGMAKPAFNARRASQIWQIFQEVFGGPERLVRVAGIWTSGSHYTDPFLTELARYGPGLFPAVQPDVIAPTTYFGNGIQDWIFQKAMSRRNGEDPWFLTPEDFSTGSTTRPVSVPANDPYWAGSAVENHMDATFSEWKTRILSGATFAGGGPDATGTGGGFSAGLADTIRDTFGHSLPIVSYEGGPSLYTDYYDGGDPRDDGITTFMILLNRRPEFAEIYRMQLNMALSKGLSTHTLFVDTSSWGKYGQWGHLEYPSQNPADSVKWSAVQSWAAEARRLRDVRHVQGTRPVFDTPGTLPGAVYNETCEVRLSVSGGECATAPTFSVIGSHLVRGLRLEPVPGDPWSYRLIGAPQEGGWSHAYLRVNDDDGDASWRVFSHFTTGGPGTLLDADFSGAFTGAGDLPATRTHSLHRHLTWSGFHVGAPFSPSGGTAIGSDGTGVQLHAQEDALRFSVSQGTLNQSDATMASALADDEFWSFTLTPDPAHPLDLRGAELLLQWIRYRYHAPRAVSVFTSLSGFREADVLHTSSQFPPPDQPGTVSLLLPESEAYQNLTHPVEIRFYFHGSQYSHQAGLLGATLTARLRQGTYPHWAAAMNWRGQPPEPQADANHNGIPNVLEYAMDRLPASPSDPAQRPRLHPESAPGSSTALLLDYRIRSANTDYPLLIEGSPDLRSWTLLQPNGSSLQQSLLHADPDGDGSAELHRLRIDPDSPFRFFRFRVAD